MNRVVERNEIVKRSTALIVFASDRCLCQVAMAVAGRIVALTIKPHVLGVGKRRRMQSMRRVKRYLQPQENRVSSNASAKKSARSCKRTRSSGIIDLTRS